jgi:hypothetical protein
MSSAKATTVRFLFNAFITLRIDTTLDIEFAEYTSAQERIALGKKARKKAAADRREAMKELIADAYVVAVELRSSLSY